MSVPATSIQTTPRFRPAHRSYAAYGAASTMWADRAPEVVMEGPAGTGKSRAVLEKLHYCACKYAGMRGLIVRKTRESMSESILVTFEDKVLPENSPIASGPNRHTRQVYRYPNGSEIIVSGLVANGKDQKAKIMSTEYDLIVVAEATEINEDEWEKLTTRLRNGAMPYQQIIGECNPDAPTHWLHQRCDRGVANVHFSRHADNPTITAQYLATLSRLSGVRKSRLFLGKRAQAEGMVYEDFDRAVHVIDRFPIPASWTRARAIDFGFTNPFVCQWWALDGDGRMYLYREIYMTGKTVKVHAAKIAELERWYALNDEGERIENPDRERIAYTIADHDAEDRETLAENRIGSVPANKAISPGIQKVQERLKDAGDGRPRLFILRDSLVERDETLAEKKQPLCTEHEFESYLWPKGQDGKPVKEVPIDLYNHGMDAMRYVVMRLDGARGNSAVGAFG